jgi:glycine/D-amino acid oxidase-like deaminating enzyme
MASELALEQPERRAAVIGCGVVGLTTTRQLQRRGFDVTIYAADVPPNTTSNMSVAAWTPTSGLVSTAERTTEWDAQLRRAARIAYGQLQLLVGREYGVTWRDGYSLSNSAPGGGQGGGGAAGAQPEPLLPPELRMGATLLGPGEHPFPTQYATLRPNLGIEPSIYLDALVRDVREAGAAIVIRRFDSMRDLAALDENVIMNCSGLGAGELIGDREIQPSKGQLTHFMPQPEVNYSTFGGIAPTPGGFLQMQPRSDGIAIGGISQRGNGSLEPDEEARRRMVDAHIAMFAAMRG